MTCPHGYDDGVYVLGALGPSERSAYEKHLADCVQCRRSVAALAALPGLLGRVDVATLEATAPTPSQVPRLVDAVSRARRRQARSRRWRFGSVLVAAASLAVAVTLVVLEAPFGGAPPQLAAMRAVVETPVSAEVAVMEAANGTEVRMRCRYAPLGYEAPARAFRLVAVGMDGSSEQVGSWQAAPGDEVSMGGITRFTGYELARLELRNADGETLLVYDTP